MRLPAILLTISLLSCSTEQNKRGLFDDLADRETVVICLSKFNLDGVPAEIGKLSKARSLRITRDSIHGWKAYPPLSAMQRMTDIPPFRKLPAEITTLTKLQSLGLAGLDLKELPANFDKLQGLDSLDIMMNKLTLSKELHKLKGLTNLKYLALSGNKVDTAHIIELKRANPNLVIESGLE